MLVIKQVPIALYVPCWRTDHTSEYTHMNTTRKYATEITKTEATYNIVLAEVVNLPEAQNSIF
jgi:hypothetical protein